MLFDNAKLEPGETVLVHAGGSGIGTAAIKMAKAIGATVITTVGDDAKAEKAKALGADHVINYRTERFEGVVRKLTAKKGVDVVFEHVGAETFNGSLLCLKRGGRLVTCGATSGPSTTLNLMQLFQQQYRIIGSFGASMRNIRESLAKMAAGMLPVIDTEVAARRVRARPRAARKPPGVRQDRRHVLRASRARPMKAQLQRFGLAVRRAPQGGGRRRSPDGSAVALLRATAPHRSPAHGQRRRPADATCRPLAAGASHRPRQPRCRVPGKIAGRDREDPARRHGTISAASPPSSPISTGWGARPRAARAGRHRSSTNGRIRPVHGDARRRQAGAVLRRPSRQLGIARAGGRVATSSTARCSTGRPTSAPSADAIVEIRAGCMGTLIPSGFDAPIRLARGLGARRAMSACWSISTTCAASK